LTLAFDFDVPLLSYVVETSYHDVLTTVNMYIILVEQTFMVQEGEHSSMSTATLEASAQASNLLTVSEVATILRVDDTTVRRWVKQGVLSAVVLPHVNTRQGYRVKRETLEKLLEGQPATHHAHHSHKS
jgi:excisionase family DNA binding protein